MALSPDKEKHKQAEINSLIPLAPVIMSTNSFVMAPCRFVLNCIWSLLIISPAFFDAFSMALRREEIFSWMPVDDKRVDDSFSAKSMIQFWLPGRYLPSLIPRHGLRLSKLHLADALKDEDSPPQHSPE